MTVSARSPNSQCLRLTTLACIGTAVPAQAPAVLAWLVGLRADSSQAAGASLGMARAYALAMRFHDRPTFRLRQAVAAFSLTAALSGCAEASQPDAQQAQREAVMSPFASTAGNAGNGSSAAGGGGTPGAASPLAPGIAPPDTTCPAEVPVLGNPCRGDLLCTYHRGGPCPPDPDVLRQCFKGKWGATAPAIFCHPIPAAEDAGVSD